MNPKYEKYKEIHIYIYQCQTAEWQGQKQKSKQQEKIYYKVPCMLAMYYISNVLLS